MRLHHTHRWDVSPADARAIQLRLRRHMVTEDRLGRIRRVAGVDVAFDTARGLTRAAVAVLDFGTLELIEHAVRVRPTAFPYVPGLLSFREVPAILEAMAALTVRPDLLLCDGHGMAHPRRFGFASHLGVLTGLPSVGVAKTRLLGAHRAVPDRRGAWVRLIDQGEVVGAVLRSRVGVKPVFVSIGHRVSLPTAVRLVMACTRRYRLPETTRWADRLASAGA